MYVHNTVSFLSSLIRFLGPITNVGGALQYLICLFVHLYQCILMVTTISEFIWERSGSVLDSRLRGRGFEPHQSHCVVVLEQETFILA